MKTHALAWFEARIGQTIYPKYTEAIHKSNPRKFSLSELRGVKIECAEQIEILYNNQVQIGTRYSDERVMA